MEQYIQNTEYYWIGIWSVQFSHSVMSNSLWPHGLQHPRLPCPSPTPRAYSNSCPLSQWCHPTISSSVIPFSSCLQPFPASGCFSVNQFFASGGQSIGDLASVSSSPFNEHSFQMSQLFTSGGESIGVSASTSVLPVNTQDWSPLGWTDWFSLQSKGLSRVFSNHSSKASILWHSAFSWAIREAHSFD